MIQTVEIQNWRAYEDVTIGLDAAVVFFVAPNGVGKSSLVEATRWALLGQPTGRRAARAVRHGSDQAIVTVEFSTEDSAIVRVTRTLTPTGRSTLTVRRGHEELTEVEYESLLQANWAADVRLIDSLMFTDPEVPAVKSAFPVRDHLAAVLGVTPLLETARELAGMAKETTGRIADLRSEIGELEGRLAALDVTAAETADSLETAVAERERLASLIEAEEERLTLAQRWDSYRTDMGEYEAGLTELLADMATLVEFDRSSPQVSLERAVNQAAERVDQVREAQTVHQVRAARAARAADLLADPIDPCPACLRPLAEHERIGALEQHGAMSAVVDDERSRLESSVAEANARLRRINQLARQFAALRLPERPVDDDPGLRVAEGLTLLRQKHLGLVERVGQLQAREDSEISRRQLAGQLALVRSGLDRSAAEEQLFVTTVDVLNALADRTLSERIDPLIAELSVRWKTLFGAEGLALTPSGQLVVRGPDGALEISDLSGGERATAFLIARLLVTAATTQIPTVWFDEPLEHLDPRRRAAVAKTLVRAGQTRTIAQLVVTTYEDRIARQLAAADPDSVRIVHADKPVLA